MRDLETQHDQILEWVGNYQRQLMQAPPQQPFELMRTLFEPEDLQAAVAVLLSGQVSMGQRVAEFEQAWSHWNQSAGSLMVNSGSSANLLALSAFASQQTQPALKPGDEVIVPAVCWSTSVFPVVQMGAIPVFVDCDPVTLNLSLEQVEAAITPQTRALVAVHVLGNPCPMPELMALARKHDLWVLEDCCEAHGATIEGVKVGNFGDLSSFSFFLSHHMTTIEGGMVCMRKPQDWQDLLISQRAHGWIRGRSDQQDWIERFPELTGGWLFVETGYNLRPTEMHAAIGLSQLGRLDAFILRRQNILAILQAHILNRWGDWLAVQQALPGHASSAFGLAILVKPGAPFERKDLQRALQSAQIFTRPLITGNFLRQPVVHKFAFRQGQSAMPGADYVHDRGFMVGIHHDLTDSALAYFQDTLDQFLGKF